MRVIINPGTHSWKERELSQVLAEASKSAWASNSPEILANRIGNLAALLVDKGVLDLNEVCFIFGAPHMKEVK
jgi:hypothetical protein